MLFIAELAPRRSPKSRKFLIAIVVGFVEALFLFIFAFVDYEISFGAQLTCLEHAILLPHIYIHRHISTIYIFLHIYVSIVFVSFDVAVAGLSACGRLKFRFPFGIIFA